MEFRCLSVSIPWRGDEDYHIFCAVQITHSLALHKMYFLALALFLIFAFLRPSLDGLLIFIAAVFFLGVTWVGHRAHIDLYHALRYPIFLHYVAATLAYFANLIRHNPYPEIPYRLLPLLSAACLAGLGFYSLRRHSIFLRLGLFFLLATLPVIRNFDSLFYLEMPAVFCMTLVCLQAIRLLRGDPERLLAMPSWIALLLLGFMKETTIPFLFVFLCCRIIFRLSHLIKNQSLGWKPMLAELKISFAICFPICLYLLYRLRIGPTRFYSPHFEYIQDAHLYWIQLHSLWDSFGLLLPIAIAGFVLLLVRRKWQLLFFLALILLVDSTFHFLDNRQYNGYSRFNLFLLPSLLVFAVEFLRLVTKKYLPYALGFLAFAIGVQSYYSPVHKDGTRVQDWGIYGVDVGDQSYPYREALKYLEIHYPKEKVLFTGLYYPYYTEFYLHKQGWPEQQLIEISKLEFIRMDSVLFAAKKNGYPVVLYHVLKSPLNLEATYGFGSVKVFKNQAHSLLLFGP